MQTTAKISRNGKHFEIPVDLDAALNVRKGLGNVNNAVLSDAVFYNTKSGDRASSPDLLKAFETDNFEQICEKIIKSGELLLPTEYVKKEKDQKYKQAVDFLVKNAVSPEGRPYTPDRIMKALEESKVDIKNKPIEAQVQEILEQLKRILPIKMEIKRLKVTIPAQFSAKAYGILHSYLKKEEWLSNGDLVAILEMPSALVFDFYDKLNSITHGSALSEEVKV